jgi:hypothetical protein
VIIGPCSMIVQALKDELSSHPLNPVEYVRPSAPRASGKPQIPRRARGQPDRVLWLRQNEGGGVPLAKAL